mgnify:CR=1 FL=1
MAKMSVDDKLGFDKFVTDEHESHILINEDYHDEAEIKRLVWHVRPTCITMMTANWSSVTKAASNVVRAASFPAAKA